MIKKIIVAQDLSTELSEKVRKLIPNWDVMIGKDPSLWTSYLKEAEIIAGWQKNMEEVCLQSDAKLKWIQSWSAGVDRYSLSRLKEQGIMLTSANGVHAFPISETIFALMLSLTRKIHTYVMQQSTKTWYHANMSHEMHGKTVGIIGVGAIGTETAKIAQAFGMKVIGVRNTLQPTPYIDHLVTASQLSKILPECDYVVVTLPLTKDTRHLFGEKQFKQMKSTSYFINIGRGQVVDELALIHALEKEQIAGAGLDVFEVEPLDPKSPLWFFENVIITPHTSGSTEYYNQRVVENIFIPNLYSYLENGAPSINIVDYKKGY